MKTVELFAGTQSFSKVARELGHETFCVESNPKFNNDLTCEINNPYFVPEMEFLLKKI